MKIILKVEVIEEFLDYTFPDLLSDFGGYLGMFIGASILSCYDAIIKCMLKFLSKHNFSRKTSNGFTAIARAKKNSGISLSK